jgi:hypothetical protein
MESSIRVLSHSVTPVWTSVLYDVAQRTVEMAGLAFAIYGHILSVYKVGVSNQGTTMCESSVQSERVQSLLCQSGSSSVTRGHDFTARNLLFSVGSRQLNIALRTHCSARSLPWLPHHRPRCQGEAPSKYQGNPAVHATPSIRKSWN